MKRFLICCVFISLTIPTLGCSKGPKTAKPGEGREALDPAAAEKASAVPANPEGEGKK